MEVRVILYPYNIYSTSAKALQSLLQEQGIKCKRVYPDGNYRHKINDLVINWGSSNNPLWNNNGEGILNKPFNVSIAANKLTTFEVLKDKVSIPEYTTDRDVAAQWKATNSTTIVRHILNGHSGKGIKVLEPPYNNPIPEAPLYVKYIKKKAEYRVHIFKGIIDVQQKRKRKDYNGEINSKIRSHQNGWVFCRTDINVPEQCIDQSKRTIEALGLDFGAVDVIWNDHQQKAYILEVNTAPGLEGTTLLNYTNKIKELLQ